MNILVIAGNYPSPQSPNNGAFVYNLMQQLGKVHKITIISPQKINRHEKKAGIGYGEEICEVLRPSYFSFSNRKLLNFNTNRLTTFFYKKAVTSVLKKLDFKPDLVYVHFLSNILPVMDYVERENVPLVVASGESTYDSWIENPQSIQRRVIKLVDHIVCVSQENKTQLKEIGFNERNITVVPNAVNYELFKPLDKNECKKNLGLSQDSFVVGFIGHFIHRKGPNRIIEAISSLQDPNIRLICVGGKGELTSNNFTSKLGPVPNHQLPEIYNSFDVFVLPTLHEGSCNVIEEAKACCVPIISSKGTSVEEQVDPSIGILVNPMSIKEISEAIAKLKNDNGDLLNMRERLMDRRGENSVQQRAKKIDGLLKMVCKIS